MNVKVFIWGVRDGFTPEEALYPVRATLRDEELTEYNNLCSHFDKAKESLFSKGEKNFYYSTIHAGYQLYSLVLGKNSHGDFLDRPSFLVFTIAIAQGIYPSSGIHSALHSLWALYRDKNHDRSVKKNLFSKEDIEKAVSDVKFSKSPRIDHKSNVIFTYSEESLVSEALIRISGANIYFIKQGSNQKMISAFDIDAYQTLPLEERLKNIERSEVIVKKFSNLFSTRDPAHIKELDEMLVQLPDAEDSLKKEYLKWKKDILNTRQQGEKRKHFLSLLEQWTVHSHTKQFTEATQLFKEIEDSLSEQEKSDYYALKSEYEKQVSEIGEAQIEQMIVQAEQSGLDEASAKKLINETITDNELNKRKVLLLRKYNQMRIDLLKQEIEKLYDDIKTSSHQIRHEKKKLWRNQIDNIRSRILTIGNDAEEIEETESYKFLAGKDWEPKSRKPVIMMLMIVAAVALFAGGIGYLMKDNEESYANQGNVSWPTEEQWQAIGETDMTKYKMENYLDTNNRLDSIKINKLCDSLKNSINVINKDSCVEYKDHFWQEKINNDWKKIEFADIREILRGSTIKKGWNGIRIYEDSALYSILDTLECTCKRSYIKKVMNDREKTVIPIKINNEFWYIKEGWKKKDGLDWEGKRYRFGESVTGTETQGGGKNSTQNSGTSGGTTSDLPAEPKPDNAPQDQTNEFAARFFQGSTIKDERIQKNMTPAKCKSWQTLRLDPTASSEAKMLQAYIKKCHCDSLPKIVK